MKRTITTLSIAAALLLTGCTSAPVEPTAPAPTQSNESSATAPQIAPAPALSAEQLEALPWASTWAVYGDAAPQDPGTPYLGVTASLPKGETYAVAYDQPGGDDAKAFALIGEHELGDDPTALPVIGRIAGWLQVLLPGRLNLPSSGKAVNGASGWVQESEVELTKNPHSVIVSKDAVEVRGLSGQVEATYPVIMDGKDLTAGARGYAVASYWTPAQRKCSTEKLLATSVQSNVYDSFIDGVSVQGIHGWSKACRAVSAQTKRSSGCVNVSDESMARLLKLVRGGTPVTFEE